MAKPQRYPKKFRMKLEKMAANREQRAAAADLAASPVFRTYYQDFLKPGSVHLIHVKADEGDDKSPPRLSTRYQLHAPIRPGSVRVDPPWLVKPPDA